MLFADGVLAARIERAECGLLTGAAEAAKRRRDADVFVLETAGGVGVHTGLESPINKLAGLGFHGPVDEGDLDRMEEVFRSRGTPVQAEVSSLGDPSVARTLTRRGYVLQNVENVLGCALPAGRVDGPPEGVEILVDSAFRPDTWLDVIVTGFASPDLQGVPSHEVFPREALEAPIVDMSGGSGFVRYLARRNGVPAGAAGMRVSEGVAQFCGSATLPEHRRNGIQTAFLGRRLADASGRGAHLAVVTTQPGSKSQENVQKHGFVLLYTRAILVLEV